MAVASRLQVGSSAFAAIACVVFDQTTYTITALILKSSCYLRVHDHAIHCCHVPFSSAHGTNSRTSLLAAYMACPGHCASR